MNGDRDRPHDWPAYYDKTGTRPPRETLLFALERFESEPTADRRFAVDLGCGGGRDTIELLRRGWRVLAIDGEILAIEKLVSREDNPPEGELNCRVSRFQDAHWPRCDLVNSSFALPLMPPDEFAVVWPRITGSLHPGGRIACQLFGPRDSWAGQGGMSFHDRADVEALLAGLEIELLLEEEDDSTTVSGEAKHWHIFHIVARRTGGLG